MSRPLICVGDALDHGGNVVTGSPVSDIDGKPISRIGDRAVCSRHGSTTIGSGDSTFIVDGQPVARHGDKTACGATLISSQVLVLIDSGAISGSRRPSTHVPTSASGLGKALGFDRSFTVTNSASGQPLAHTPYRITLADGRFIEGVTDEDGRTEKVAAATAMSATIEVLA